MTSGIEKAITGKNWRSTLAHVEYEDGRVSARHEFHDLGRYDRFDYVFVTKDKRNGPTDRFEINVESFSGPIINPSFSSSYAVPINSPLRSKIIQVIVYIIDLDFKLKIFEEILKHHVIEMVTASGHRFTIEKAKEYITLQSCLTPLDQVPLGEL